MADTLLVRPAPGLLVAFSPHRPGQYIGVKRAPADAKPEDIFARVDGGHSYVEADEPVSVPATAYYVRCVQRGDLVEEKRK